MNGDGTGVWNLPPNVELSPKRKLILRRHLSKPAAALSP